MNKLIASALLLLATVAGAAAPSPRIFGSGSTFTIQGSTPTINLNAGTTYQITADSESLRIIAAGVEAIKISTGIGAKVDILLPVAFSSGVGPIPQSSVIGLVDQLNSVAVSTTALDNSKLDKSGTSPLVMTGPAATITTQSSVTASGIFADSFAATSSMKVGGLPSNLPFPLPAFEVAGNGFAAFIGTVFSNSSDGPVFLGLHAGGTSSVPLATPNNAVLSRFSGIGYDGSGFGWSGGGGRMDLRASEVWSPTARGTKWVLDLTPNGTITQLPAITSDGSGNVEVSGSFLAASSSVTANAFFGDGSALTGIPTTSDITAIGASTQSLRTDLNTEISDRTTADTAIGVATNTLRTDLTTETNARITADTAIGVSTRAITDSKGQANGIASLDGGAKIPVAQLPNSVMEYQGAWVPGTNTPTLADGIGNNGDVYRASADGSADTGHGVINYFTGDFIIYSGTIWERSPMADGVSMVNGYTGAVVLVTDDIAEDGSPVNLWFTDSRAQAANAASFTAVGAATNTLRSDTFTQFAQVAASTAAIGVATGTIRTDFTAADTAIGAATNTLRSDTFTQFDQVAASTAAIGVATGTIRTDLTAETAARIAADAAIGISTANLASGSATTYVHTDGSNAMTGDLRTPRVVADSTTLNGVPYNWPQADGSASQRLTTDGSGNLSWATVSGSGSGHGISTGSLTVGATIYTQRDNLVFDSRFFSATDLPSLNETFIGLSTTTAVPASSQTSNGWASASGVNTTFGASIPGSTLTITTNGGDVDYQFTGSCRLDSTTNRMGLVVYQDGNVTLPAKLSASALDGTNTIADLGMGSPGTATVEGNCSFTKTFKNVPAGVHSYSLAAAVNSGTWFACGTYGACSAIVREVTSVIGGSGSSGHTIATSTGTDGAPLTTFTARNNLTFDAAGFELTDDVSLNSTRIRSKGYQYLTSTTSYPSGSRTASTLGPCIANSTVTWTQGNNRALICFSGSAFVPAEAYFGVGLLLDGDFIPGYSATKGQNFSYGASAANNENMSFCLRTPTLSAGPHSACLSSYVTGGNTISIPASTTFDSVAELSVMELATGGSGFATPASSSTFNIPSNTSITNSAFGVCLGTVTLNSGGAEIELTVNGSIDNSGTGQTYATILEDGAHISRAGFSSTKSMWEATSPAAFFTVPMAFSVKIPAPSAGQHSYCLALRTSGGTSRYQPASSQPNGLAATEARNAPGTGDVSSSGSNIMSGANAFNGSTVFNGSVSGPGVNFQYLASTVTYIPNGATSQNTTNNPSVCLTTATITTGNNRLLIVNNGGHQAGSTVMYMNFLIDGQSIPGWPAGSSSVRTCGTWDNASSDANMACSIMTPVLSAGTHNVCVAMGSSGGGATRQQQTSIMEIASGGSGYALAASTYTIINTDATTTNTTLGVAVAGSTITYTHGGGGIEISFMGTINNDGSGTKPQLSVLMDGAFLPGYTSTKPMLEGREPGAGSVARFPVTINYKSTGTIPAGQHSFALTIARDTAGGTTTLLCGTNPCYFHVGEVRNAAGTGDVSSSGDNAFSGSNSFTGPLSGGALLRQTVSSFTAANLTQTVAIPYDDTLPQITEGNQVVVATMTPISATSLIELEVNIQMCEPSNVCDQFAISVYEGSGPNPVEGCVFAEERGITSGIRVVKGICRTSAVSMSARNYSVRYGGNTSTCAEINGCSGRKYGGGLRSGIIIREIAQ